MPIDLAAFDDHGPDPDRQQRPEPDHGRRVSITLVSGTTYSDRRPVRPDRTRRELHPDRQRRRHPDTYGNLGHRLALDVVADGHDAADQRGQPAASPDNVHELHRLGHQQRPEPGRTAARRQASPRSRSTTRKTAVRSPSSPPSRPRTRPRHSRPAPATPTASTASRPTTPATSRRLRLRPSRPCRSSRRSRSVPSPPSRPTRETQPSRASTSRSASPSTSRTFAYADLTLTDNGGREPDHERRHASAWSPARPTRSTACPV